MVHCLLRKWNPSSLLPAPSSYPRNVALVFIVEKSFPMNTRSYLVKIALRNHDENKNSWKSEVFPTSSQFFQLLEVLGSITSRGSENDSTLLSRTGILFSEPNEVFKQTWIFLFRGRIQLDFTPYKMSQVSCPNVKHVQSSLVFRSLNLQFFVPCLCGFVRLSTTFGTWNSSQICLNLKTSTRETQQSCRRREGRGEGVNWMEKRRGRTTGRRHNLPVSVPLAGFRRSDGGGTRFLKVSLTFRGWNQIFNSIKRIKRGS